MNGQKKRIRAQTTTQVRIADPSNAVVTTESNHQLYRRKPCNKCPWRKDAVGEFPPEVFRISATTAYDMADAMFGCHESGVHKSTTCAGFLLRGAEHNFAVRMAQAFGQIGDDVCAGDLKLHDSYRAMAVANGVDPADPVLAKCRD